MLHLILLNILQWSIVHPEEMLVAQLFNTFPALYGIKCFLSPPLDSTLSQLNLIQVLIINIILLRLGLLSGFFPSGFPTRIVYSFPSRILHAYFMSFPSLHDSFDNPNNIWQI
jgi:hypothetical protein